MEDLKDNLILTLNSSLNSIIDVSSGTSVSIINLTNYRSLVTVVYSS